MNKLFSKCWHDIHFKQTKALYEEHPEIAKFFNQYTLMDRYFASPKEAADWTAANVHNEFCPVRDSNGFWQVIYQAAPDKEWSKVLFVLTFLVEKMINKQKPQPSKPAENKKA